LLPFTPPRFLKPVDIAPHSVYQLLRVKSLPSPIPGFSENNICLPSLPSCIPATGPLLHRKLFCVRVCTVSVVFFFRSVPFILGTFVAPRLILSSGVRMASTPTPFEAGLFEAIFHLSSSGFRLVYCGVNSPPFAPRLV